MSAVADDSFKFVLETKKFEKEAYDAAVSQARELAQKELAIRVHRTSARICNRAFETFKSNLEATFPSESYANLIFLTLKSRELLFFGDLKERVKAILRRTNQDESFL